MFELLGMHEGRPTALKMAPLVPFLAENDSSSLKTLKDANDRQHPPRSSGGPVLVITFFAIVIVHFRTSPGICD